MKRTPKTDQNSPRRQACIGEFFLPPISSIRTYAAAVPEHKKRSGTIPDAANPSVVKRRTKRVGRMPATTADISIRPKQFFMLRSKCFGKLHARPFSPPATVLDKKARKPFIFCTSF
jgi:hypothetical protein